MSSSCLRRSHALQRAADLWPAILLVTIGWPAPTPAAELYVQPIVTLAEEYDSNLDYDPTLARGTIGYMADAATLIGFATPDSDTNIRPRIRYEDYPTETSLDRVQAMVDVNSGYSSPRNNFSLYGRFDHLTDVEAENPSAVYNDVSGSAPTLPETGAVNVNATRDSTWVTPGYTYKVTPLTQLGVSGVFQRETFSIDDPTRHVPFNYYQGNLSVGRDFGPTTGVRLEGYAARFEALNIHSNADSVGASVDLDFKWSALFTGGLSAQYQRADIDATQPNGNATPPTVFRGIANTWGASFKAQWRQRNGRFRLTVGRIITPSSGGGLYAAEQAQTQYDRSLSERLTFTGAVMFVRSQQLAGLGSGFEHIDHRADLSLKWMLKRTWFLQGGYGYVWDYYAGYLNGATNERVFLQFGYQGLGRQY